MPLHRNNVSFAMKQSLTCFHKYFRDTRENVALITHKYETMKMKYEDAVTKIHSLNLLEAENEVGKLLSCKAVYVVTTTGW